MSTAQTIYDKAFHPARDPRSDQYKAGVLAALQSQIHSIKTTEPCKLGTVELDAWLSGWDEGYALSIARTNKFRRGVVDSLEGARLMAVVPELLEALQAVWIDITSPEADSCISFEAGQKVRAAIEKATGTKL